MIKKFKLFEGYGDISKTLIDQLDYDFIDEIFDKYYLRDAKEIIELWPNSIWSHIDDDEYVKDFIRDEISSLSIEDFSEYDYRQYLEYNISNRKEKKILKLYNQKQLKKGKETERDYDSDMLEKLSEKQLRKIIKYENEEEEFVTYIVNDRYEKSDAKEIIEENYGKRWMDDNGAELYKIFSDYIDDDAIVDEWKDSTNKKYELQEQIYNNKEIQNKLLEVDKENVLLLTELFIEDSGNNISDEFDFQESFIEMYVKKHINNDNDKDEDYLRAEALKYLDDNDFEINDDIQENYNDDMWMINAKKYNL